MTAIPDDALVYIDTNILIAHLLGPNDDLAKVALNFFMDCESMRFETTTSSLAIFEGVALLNRKKADAKTPIISTPAQMKGYREDILKNLTRLGTSILEIEDCLLETGPSLASDAGQCIMNTLVFIDLGNKKVKAMQILDGLQAAMAERNGCDYIISGDGDFARAPLRSMKYINVWEEYK